MPPKATSKKDAPERNLPALRNQLMLGEVDPIILGTKCRVQDVRFGGSDQDGVTETFVRIKTQLPSANMPHFIMRKAVDDYVSATSMFRAVFYGATTKQEKHEMDVVRKELAARSDDNASGVWIPGTPDALQLAELYGIKPWVQALLDAPTSKSSYSQDDRRSSNAATSPQQSSSAHQSPAVAATPSRKTTRERSQSPRKIVAASARKVKKAAEKTIATIQEDVNGVTETVKDSLPTLSGAGIKIADLLENVTGSSEPVANQEDDENEVKYTATIANEGQSMADMVKEARAQVEEAQRKDNEALTSSGLGTSKTKNTRSKKRPLEKDEDELVKDQTVSVKRSRVEDLEVQVIKEKRKVRALFGLVIGLGATAILPYIL